MAKFKIDVYSDVSEAGKLNPHMATILKEGVPKFAGKRIHVLIEEVKNTRSAKQQGYYFGGVISSQQDCFKEMWGAVFSKEQIHNWNLTNIWFIEVVNENTGEIFKMPGTSKVDVETFETRLEMLRQFFWEKFNWQIPLPETQIDLNFGK